MSTQRASVGRDDFWPAVDDLKNGLQRSKAVHVNSAQLRQSAYDLAQRWFRDTRPAFSSAGVSDSKLADADTAMQELLRLSIARSKKASYSRVLNAARRCRGDLEAIAAQRVGDGNQAPLGNTPTVLEMSIIRTLQRLNPTAASCYHQVIDDLATPRRSYRGTATELREVVREVLDQLAPDDAVMGMPGYKHDKDRVKPTMKQKARHILKARGLGESARSAPEKAVELLEEQIASIVRSVYDRGSVSTHTGTTRAEVLSFKGYADAVLAELLQVHLA